MTNNKLIHVAIAIIYREDKFLMQLRDNIPGIVYPGYWGLFGGHLEDGENPEDAVKRELAEEIGYIPSTISRFYSAQENQIMRHIFQAPLTVELEELVLTEGWDMALLTPADIRSGSFYSDQAGMVMPIGPPHQKILLNFVEHKGNNYAN